MIRKTALAAAATLLASIALVPATAGTLVVKDGNAATQTLRTVTNTDTSQSYVHAVQDTTGTLIDPATKQLQQSIITALGTPFQAGGSIGNTSFGISGTLPAFAATPTFNIGTAPSLTIGTSALPTGAATAALQSSTSSAIVTALGSPLQAGGTVNTVVQGTATDRGAVVTTAGTAQQLMASNSSRRGFSVQNQSSGACYINGSATATQDYHSLLVAAGSFYETKDSHTGTGAVSVICAAANASVYAREW